MMTWRDPRFEGTFFWVSPQKMSSAPAAACSAKGSKFEIAQGLGTSAGISRSAIYLPERASLLAAARVESACLSKFRTNFQQPRSAIKTRVQHEHCDLQTLKDFVGLGARTYWLQDLQCLAHFLQLADQVACELGCRNLKQVPGPPKYVE